MNGRFSVRAIRVLAAASVACGVFESGCVSKSNARLRTSAAYSAGRAQALEQMQRQNAPVVSVAGLVRSRTVAWHEGLTVAEAIVAAEYVGGSNPRSIYVTRRGERTFIDPKQLLRGNDFLLESGDFVEIGQ